MDPLAVVGLGLFLGLRHATDPDHVIAVTAIAARTKRLLPAAWLGIVWGLGHTLTLFVVGGAILAFNLAVPPRLGLALEFAVGIALVVVGLSNLRANRHEHAPDLAGSRAPALRAFAVGTVHGLAGSAAVALLVLATVRDPRVGAAYLLVFGLGTLAGMTLVTTSMAAPVGLAARRWKGLPRIARLATGVLSLGFGLWLMWSIGWQDGLFRAVPRWDPH